MFCKLQIKELFLGLIFKFVVATTEIITGDRAVNQMRPWASKITGSTKLREMKTLLQIIIIED